MRASRLIAIAALGGILAATWLTAGACGRRTATLSRADAIRLGDEAASRRDYRAAITAYLTAVDAEPRDGQTRRKLAEAYRGANQFANFVREAVTASDLLPDNRDAQLLAIEALTAGSRFDEALERLGPQLAASPDDPRVLVLLGNAKARLLAPSYGLHELSEAWRNGLDFETVRLRARRAPTTAEDRTAENALRRAYQLDSKLFETQASLISFLWITNRLDEGAELLKRAADAMPQEAFLHRALGLYYERQQKLVEAEAHLKTAASAHDYESSLALASLLEKSGRLEEALAVLRPLTSRQDDDGAATVRAAEIEITLRRYADALQKLDNVLARDSGNKDALLAKARALLASGNPKAALAAARSSLAMDPSSTPARLILADALVQNDDLVHAFDEYRRAWRTNLRDPDVARKLASVALALGRYGIAEDLAGQSLRLQPGNLEAAGIFARAQIKLGNYAAAERILTPILAVNPDSAGLLELQGTIQAGRGNDEAARTAFTKALKINPDSLDALNGLLGVEVRARHPERAKPPIDAAVARHPRDPGYLFLVAQFKATESDARETEKALRAVLQIDPAYESALLQLAALLVRQGRNDEAQRALEPALQAKPALSALRLALADVLERRGKTEAARAEYDRVIVDNQLAGAATDMLKTLHTASARLAALYANQGIELDRAFQLAGSAIRSFPKEPAFNDTLGWVYVRMARAKAGLPYLDTAVRAEPASGLYRYHLGAAYEQLGEIEKARAELVRALQGDQAFLGAADARALLATIGK